MNGLTSFLSELALRLFSEKPKFFVTIQWLSFLTGGVSVLISYLKTTSLVLPVWIESVANVNVFVASVVALIIAQFTNSDPIVAEKINNLRNK